MRLARIWPPSPLVYCGPCRKCGRGVWSGHDLADLDGPAFRAYYHRGCAPTEEEVSSAKAGGAVLGQAVEPGQPGA